MKHERAGDNESDDDAAADQKAVKDAGELFKRLAKTAAGQLVSSSNGSVGRVRIPLPDTISENGEPAILDAGSFRSVGGNGHGLIHTLDDGSPIDGYHFYQQIRHAAEAARSPGNITKGGRPRANVSNRCLLYGGVD